MKESIYKVESISQLHEVAGIEEPKHSHVSIIDYSKVDASRGPSSGRFVLDFYTVAFKKRCSFLYGKEKFDHQEGSLHCTAPGQIITYNREDDDNITGGWGLYFHSDLLDKKPLGSSIHQYTYFMYSENESLFLRYDEQETLNNLLEQIDKELSSTQDNFSDELIVSNIELLLNYCKRFYCRQFDTRSSDNKSIITKFETFIMNYIHTGKLKESGLPSVKHCAANMNLTPNYFSDLLKNETGMNTQEHIHHHIIEKAKSLLAGTDFTVNQVADELGFEYPQYFSKLFKKKVGLTPVEFRSQ